MSTSGCQIRTARMAHRTLWAFCFVALSTPLLVPTSWIHYFVHPPLVLTFLAAELAGARLATSLKSAAASFVLAPSAWLSSLACFDFMGSARLYAERGCPLIANLLLLALAYALYFRANKSPVTGPDTTRPFPSAHRP